MEGYSMTDSVNFNTWDSGYRRAIYSLATCRHEAINSELTEPHRYARYADRYTFGLDLVKFLTGKTYAEIDRDINLVYNKAYGNAAREGREQ
nr:MAG TPA: hypothetical protein [Caudoviricetes sp.]